MTTQNVHVPVGVTISIVVTLKEHSTLNNETAIKNNNTQHYYVKQSHPSGLQSVRCILVIKCSENHPMVFV